MKKLILGVCLLALGAACKTSGASMHDTSKCTGKDCADCAMEHKEDCASCPGEKAECEMKEGAVCPVTGKSTN